MTEPTLESIARCQERTLLIVQQLATKVDDRIEHDDAWREKMDLMISGDGNGRKGFQIRVDRLEQTAERQKWLVRTLGSAVLVLALKVGVDLMTG